MWSLIVLTATLFAGVVLTSAYVKRDEIIANWALYRDDPVYMLGAPLFKPDDDPRSRLKFATDNFSDSMQSMLERTFAIMLAPVFKILGLISDAINETTGGLLNMRTILGKMWNQFNQIIDIFNRRFNTVLAQLRLNNIKMHTMFQKAFAVATASVYNGISTIHTITSFLDLIMKVIIIILVIMVILFIFLIFVLWPFIPTILVVVGIISTTVFAGAVGGMADTFCFAGGTMVQTVAGPVPIETIKMGAELVDGGRVKGVMRFQVKAMDLYALYGVQVSGSHIVYYHGVPMHVKQHPAAILLQPCDVELYCLITDDHKIPVVSNNGVLWFSDWEELSGADALLEWNKIVHKYLNPDAPFTEPRMESIHSEAACSGKVRVATPQGSVAIHELRPGSIVLDASGVPTRVHGIVELDGSEITHGMLVCRDGYISAGTWLQNGTRWVQPRDLTATSPYRKWYSIFTESGTYMLESGMQLRDFTDVGPESIMHTYSRVLEILRS